MKSITLFYEFLKKHELQKNFALYYCYFSRAFGRKLNNKELQTVMGMFLAEKDLVDKYINFLKNNN